MIKKFLMSALFLISLSLSAKELAKDSTLHLIFMGDVMGHETQIKGAYNPKTGEYNYHECFKFVKEEISKPDLAIANLEVTLAGRPYKGYPAFSSPDTLATALKDAGIDLLLTANNHSCDRQKKGIIRTLDVLDRLQIPHTGTFRNKKERQEKYPLLIEKNGFKLAFLNYTYATNGIPVPSPTIVNLIDKEQIKKDLDKAKELKPDQVIVCVHWGVEYKQHPHDSQKDLYQFMTKHGADLVIGSHPHVIQPMHQYGKGSVSQGLVVYSMGNYISNQRTQPRDGGAMVSITLAKNKTETKVKEAGYLLTWVYNPKINGKRHFFVLPVDKFVTQPHFFDNSTYFKKMSKFYWNGKKLLDGNNTNFREYRYDDRIGEWVLLPYPD